MKLNIVFAASEAAPFAKTGGLADVAGSLPAALKGLGCKVSLFLPFYREIALSGREVEPTGKTVAVPLGRRVINAGVFRVVGAEVDTYLLKRDEYFDRSFLYGTPEGDYFDNLERYAFFSRGVIEASLALGLKPHIIHANDWQTGLIPAYLRDVYSTEKALTSTATLFTIHNVAYQGRFPSWGYDGLGLSPGLFTHEGIEFWGDLSLLKAGVVYSDIITTVSPGYSMEIQTPEFAHGLEGLFKQRRDSLYGVLNGVDYREWNPATDTLIPANYTAAELRGKSVCRRALLREFGLKPAHRAPVVGIVTRFAAQKGLDIVIEALPALLKHDLRVVVLGRGDKKYEDLLTGLARKFTAKLGVKVVFDNGLAHLVEAGSDIFLMPSRYEPCGLNQIYSLRYGTIPVVRATGGLNDTVKDYPVRGATGFKFREYSAKALIKRLDMAIGLFRQRNKWRVLQHNAMAEDFSWETSAMKYIELYKRAMKDRRKALNPEKVKVKRPKP